MYVSAFGNGRSYISDESSGGTGVCIAGVGSTWVWLGGSCLGAVEFVLIFVVVGVNLSDWWKNVFIRFDFVVVFSDEFGIISHLTLISFGVMGLFELFTIIPVV